MNYYFLTQTNMTKKLGVLKTALVGTALAVAPTTSVEASQIVCKTKQACQTLSNSIQAQIDELEKSDDPDYDKLDELEKELIAIENNKQLQQEKLIAEEKSETAQKDKVIAEEKSETQYNEKIIAEENDKQLQQEKLIAEEKLETKEEEVKTQAKLAKVSARLDSIEGSL